MVCIVTDNEYGKSFREITAIIENELSGFVTEKRLSHILSVRKTACVLCDFFLSLGAQISAENVGLSALLHDITKCMDQEELCERYGIELSGDDIASPEILHARTGACFAKERYGVCDEVVSAIEKHTVGDDYMSLTDKIIFVSDYCEETRSHIECRKSRAMLLEMMDKACRAKEHERLSFATRELDYIIADILAKTVKYLRARGDFVHTKTVSTYRSVLSRYKGDRDFEILKGKYDI